MAGYGCNELVGERWGFDLRIFRKVKEETLAEVRDWEDGGRVKPGCALVDYAPARW